MMLDINHPSILGYLITPWLIVFILAISALIGILIFIMLGLSHKKVKEQQMLAKAIQNTSGTSLARAKGLNATESLIGKSESMGFGTSQENSTTFTEGLVTTEGFKSNSAKGSEETKSFEDGNTESFNSAKENDLTNSWGENTNFCSNCGSKIEGDNFCLECGYKLD